MVKWSCWSSALFFGTMLVAGCGSPHELASNAETVARTEEPVEGPFDFPVVSAVETTVAGVRQLWAFGCDVNGHFRRSIANIVAGPKTWSAVPDDYGAGCTGVPSVITRQLSTEAHYVVAYTSWDDNHLWALIWNDSSGQPFWGDVSGNAGFTGIVERSPAAVYANSHTGVLTVSARSSDRVYTFDLFNGAWLFDPVMSGNTQIRTTNTLQANAFGGNSYLSGRGLGTANDNSGWVASRPSEQHGSFTRTSEVPNFFPRGTPVVASTPTGAGKPWIIANMEGVLKKSRFGTFEWTNIPGNCTMVGSPSKAGGVGFFRTANQKLGRYFLDNCFEHDVFINSGPEEGGANAFFKGTPFNQTRVYHYDGVNLALIGFSVR